MDIKAVTHSKTVTTPNSRLRIFSAFLPLLKQSLLFSPIPAVFCSKTGMFCIIRSFLCFNFFGVCLVISAIFLCNVSFLFALFPPLICLAVRPSNVLIACFFAAFAAIICDCLPFPVSRNHPHERRCGRCNDHLSACSARSDERQAPVSFPSYAHIVPEAG